MGHRTRDSMISLISTHRCWTCRNIVNPYLADCGCWRCPGCDAHVGVYAK